MLKPKNRKVPGRICAICGKRDGTWTQGYVWWEGQTVKRGKAHLKCVERIRKAAK